MVYIDARVVSLYGTIHAAVLHVSSDNVHTHVQRNYLLVVEHVLYDGDVAALAVLNVVFRNVLFLCVAQLGYAYAYAKLLAAIGALEHQRLAFGVFLLVECDEVITFWASYSFHLFNFCYPTSFKFNIVCQSVTRFVGFLSCAEFSVNYLSMTIAVGVDSGFLKPFLMKSAYVVFRILLSHTACQHDAEISFVSFAFYFVVCLVVGFCNLLAISCVCLIDFSVC